MEETLSNPGPRATIGRYTVLAKLGEGGMAEIYMSELRGTKGFSKRVVVKVLKREHLDDAEQQSMFADEARLGSKLEHAHIPRVIELGEHEGLPYMVQEYVEGPNLDEALRRAKKADDLHIPTMCRVIADVALALHHAHHAVVDGAPLEVVHRDVSMSNVLVSVTGKSKLIDFGVARFEDRETKTEADVLKGKMRYLAPETLRHGQVSHQTDLFALGVVLYTITTGRAPWRNRSQLARRMRGTFPAPSEVLPDYPDDLAAIVLGAMAPDPAKRVKTGAELSRQLRDWCLANGGIPTDADVAERVGTWFPEGRTAWVPEKSLDPDTFGSLGKAASRSDSARRAWRFQGWAFAGVAVASALIAVLGIGILSGALYLGSGGREPERVVEIIDPLTQQEAAFLAVVERGEGALANGELSGLGRAVRTLEGMTSSDPALLARRQALRDELKLRLDLEALEPLFEDDPAEALERASLLQVLHPDDERVQQAMERAREALAAKPEPVPAARPEPARPRPAPAPAPAASGPSMLSVRGSPEGAEVVVDGRVVGTVPMELVVDGGTHDVALRKEGFVQRRVHIQATGEDLEVAIDLPALQQPP